MLASSLAIDLTDVATLGCVEWMMREAWDSWVSVDTVGFFRTRITLRRNGRPDLVIEDDDRATAIVRAWEAAG